MRVLAHILEPTAKIKGDRKTLRKPMNESSRQGLLFPAPCLHHFVEEMVSQLRLSQLNRSVCHIQDNSVEAQRTGQQALLLYRSTQQIHSVSLQEAWLGWGGAKRKY